ncbi:zinc-binding dehydrogenase [Gordonia terrae]
MAATLTNAGLTSYHAVHSGLEAQPHARFALVIGIGGLGHLAVQELVAESEAHIIAVDVDPAKLELARRLGARDAYLSDAGTAEAISTLVDGRQIDLVIDFVGAQATVDLAAALTAPGGSIITVGLASGTLAMTAGLGAAVAPDVDVRHVSVGGRDDLAGVLALARAGALTVEVEEISLAEASDAIERLDHGGANGRIVVTS